MVLLLNEADIAKLADPKMILTDVETALKEYGDKETTMPSLYQMDVLGTPATIRVMLAALPGMKASGLKILTGTAGKRRIDGTYFVVTLFDSDGSVLCLMSANRLTQLRTGAASAVATKYLARKDAEVLCIIGGAFRGLAKLKQ